jgi:hypothetical protein
VRGAVLAQLRSYGSVVVSDDGAEYKRGALTMNLGEQNGAAITTYAAVPTSAFGHSSGVGLSLRPTPGSVGQVAREIIARLQDPFLHRSG